MTGRRLAKNALANVASGTSAAILAIVLPPILVRHLDKTVYSTWALILQIGAYTALLNFGIQVAVGRFVAHYGETGEYERRDQLVSTAWAGLAGSAVAGVLAMFVIAWVLPGLFPRIPRELTGEARQGLCWVGPSLALGLPFSAYMGVFVGRQRYEVPALIQVASRLATGLLLILTVNLHPGLVPMARAFALANLLTYVIQYLVFRRQAEDCKISLGKVRWGAAKDLWDYCFSLTVWNVAMLMVTGLDVVIVGRVEFGAVAAYSIAAGIIGFIAGLQNAVFNVLIPASAVLGAASEEKRLEQMLLKGTRLGTVLLLLTSLPLVLAAPWILKVYLGSGWAAQTTPFLILLVLGNFIRLTATPYAVLMIGTGQQKLITITPLVEGGMNLIASITLGLWIGAKGVAIGTVIGSVIAIACNLFYNFPRTRQIPIRIWDYLVFGILAPVGSAFPLIVWWFACHFLAASPLVQGAGIFVAACVSILILWYRVMTHEEQALVVKAISWRKG